MHFSLPIQDPVLIFTLVLLIILLAPLLLRRLRIPGLIGLIVAGIAVGPNGFNLLQRDASIVLFGTVGLLYIMFLAGLEIDLTDFKKNRNRSIVFGLFTFLIPQVLGTLIVRVVLQFEWPSAILLASMFASHTLLAYPIVSRLGLVRVPVVGVTIGGTMITDTLALLVLAVVAGSARGELGAQFWFQLAVSLPLLAFVVLWVFPRIGAWFFKHGQGDGSAQYIFVLAVVFAAAFLSELAGVEPIIGAFLAGLALNRLIPHTSPLMNRIEFIGNTLFIPFFLIGVGMLVDLRVLFQGTEALVVAATMIILALGGKWLAAWGAARVFGYNRTEQNVIFGLSSAQAAATLAAVLVGFQLGLLNENVLNGTILMILVTCLLSTLVVENAGRQLAIQEAEQAPEIEEAGERILVPIANPATIEQLLDLAVMVKDPKSTEPIYPLVVVKDDAAAQEHIRANQKMLEKAMKHAAATETTLQIASRVDLNAANGIRRAINELMITNVIIGWNGEISTTRRIFGSVLDNLLERTQQMILVSKISHSLNVIGKIIVVIPELAEREVGFIRWVKTVQVLAKQTGAKLHFNGSADTLAQLQAIVSQTKPAVEARYHEFSEWEDFLILSREIKANDLLIVISARRGMLSYNKYLNQIPAKLARHFQAHSFVILYPEQYAVEQGHSTN